VGDKAETMVAEVKSIRYERGTFRIVSVETECMQRETVLGDIEGVAVDMVYEFSGQWKKHQVYGRQFRAVTAVPVRPTSSFGVLDFLEQLPQIGPERSLLVMEHFDNDYKEVFRVIEEEPEKLVVIKGITAERAAEIKIQFEVLKKFKDDIILLKGLGVTDRQCRIIIEHAKFLGRTIEEILEEDPYQFVRVRGLSFGAADKIALGYGIDSDDPRRVDAVLEHVLECATTSGHCFLDYILLRSETLDYGIGGETAEEGIERLWGAGRLVVEQDHVYLGRLYRSEVGVSEALHRLSYQHDLDVDEVMEERVEGWAIELHKDQLTAVRNALVNNVSIITGGPGTGKTTCLRKIVSALGGIGIRNNMVFCCAPTGKAAIRMKQQSGIDAKTIHRLLEVDAETGSFVKNAENPLYCSAVIVDEASMVDIGLMASLLRAMSSNTRLILIGDVDQLPAVGPGNVLNDLISSGKIETTRLTKVFRQSEHSWISENASAIKNGEMPNLDDDDSEDFFFKECNSAADIPDVMVDLVGELRSSGVLKDDIQVLCPQKKKVIGTENLNELFQETFNPHEDDKPWWYAAQGRIYLRDRVIHTINNYQLMVMNGEIGSVRLKDGGLDLGYLQVDYGDRNVDYDVLNLYELRLAYALTVHKSQGSEYPIVIVPVHELNKFMLTRKLLYTAVTRGKERVYLIGQRSAVRAAVQNNRDELRNTDLMRRVLDIFDRGSEEQEKPDNTQKEEVPE